MGYDIDTTKPGNTDVVADYPPEARSHRGDVEDLISAEHHEGVGQDGSHKIGVYQDDTARDAAITSPKTGNFAFQKGSAPAADAPRMLALSFYDGSDWLKGYFIPTGMRCDFFFDATTPPEGFLACDGAAVSRTTYADLFAVIGTAFDQQDSAAAPAGTDFRVPLVGGVQVMGLTASKHGQAGWVRKVGSAAKPFVSGTYSDTARRIYLVEITVTGPGPSRFRWSDDGGATWTTGVSITASNSLNHGLSVVFPATMGHSVGDVWSFVADPNLATPGATVGVDAWQLVEAEIPTLTHDSQGAHDHGVTVHETGGGTARVRGATTGGSTGTVDTATGGAHVHAAHGGDEAHPVTPHAVIAATCVKT